MAWSKLEKLLKKEINHYLGLPYARNYWKDGLLTKEAILGGKGNWTDIEYATTCATEKYNLEIGNLSPKKLYNFQKKNHIGIDCSALVYHLLDFIDQHLGNSGILYKVVSTGKNREKHGVRVVSASCLTSPINSQPITNYADVRVGDIIRHHSGSHVLLITSKKDNRITYVHSSNQTLINGVHTGHLYIVDPKMPLSYQEWSDLTKTNQKYQLLSNPKHGDGIYRLNCWV